MSSPNHRKLVAYIGALVFSGLVWIGVIVLVRSSLAGHEEDARSRGAASPVILAPGDPVRRVPDSRPATVAMRNP